MSPQVPDTPPVSPITLWPVRDESARGQGRARPVAGRMLAVAASLLAICLLAAWALPPLLDWGRFRTGIASIAAAQLGRKVVIDGAVSLRLLPDAVLTASNVALPDGGDGVSARLGSLRLQVAVLPLLAGRIVPRDLVLGAPVLRLPWPLPDALTHPARPLVPHAFAAHVENGTVLVGQAQITAINADIHGGPEPVSGLAAIRPEAAADLGAEGFAAFAGRSWRFTGALGVPDADGVSAVDLAVSGQSRPARGKGARQDPGQTSGSVQAILADGMVQGRLHAGGPDLSALLPAAALPWHVDAPFVMSGTQIEATGIGLSLGSSAADARFVLRLAQPAHLDMRLHAAALHADDWAAVLGRMPIGLPKLPMRVAWSADAVTLLGGTVQGAQGVLVSDGTTMRVEAAEAVLPGHARLAGHGIVAFDRDGFGLTGPVQLDAPDLRATLAWLGVAWLGVSDDGLPPGVLRRATLAGTGTLAPTSLSLAGLSGEIDGAKVGGGIGVAFGVQRHIGGELVFDRLVLDDWMPASWSQAVAAAQALAATGSGAVPLRTDLHIKAAQAGLHGLSLHDASLDVRTGGAGLIVDQISAGIAGAHVVAYGTLGPDGRLSATSLTASATELAPLLDVLPVSLRWAPGLWHGPGKMQATASGAPDALGVQLRADLGDLLLEADLHGDMTARTAAGSVTLRHPGAPRLLAALGVAGAERWLSNGSLAVRAQVAWRPGQLDMSDFDLTAAELRLGGHLTLATTGAEPFLGGMITAEQLSLPASADIAGWGLGWLRGWAAQLHLAVTEATMDRAPIAGAVTADLGLGGGDGLLTLHAADVAGGKLDGQLAFDARADRPALAGRASLAGAHFANSASPRPVDWVRTDLDGAADFAAEGANAAALRRSLAGDLEVHLRDGEIAGFSLAQAGLAATKSGAAGRAALQAALSGGSTDSLSGEIAGEAASGQLRLAPASLVSAAGSVGLQGGVDFGAGSLDLILSLMPTRTNRQGIGVRLTGPWASPHATPEFGTAAIPRTRPAKNRHR